MEITRVTIEPAEAKLVPIKSEYSHFIVFLPFPLAFLMGLLGAKIVGSSIECLNADTQYRHMVEILWFNGFEEWKQMPLGFWPQYEWQVLLRGENDGQAVKKVLRSW